ncbi:MAG: response regulator [candidate division Zixibacteria bacterium]|nr:response regulator [candidate division Zixibacteria bacterium]
MGSSADHEPAYFHLKKSAWQRIIVAQIDDISRLCSKMLRADVVALFYRSDSGYDLIPVSILHADENIKEIGLLEKHWAVRGRAAQPVATGFEVLTEANRRDDGQQDLFATANGFTCSYCSPLYDTGQLRCLIVAYWWHRPSGLDSRVENFVPPVTGVLYRLLSLTHELRTSANYSRRLSDLIRVSDTSLRECRFSELITRIVNQVQNVVPIDGSCIISRDRPGGAAQVRESKGPEPFAGYGDTLLQRLVETCGGAVSAHGEKHLCHDLSPYFKDHCGGVAAVDISPDDELKFVLAVWTADSDGFSVEDRELMSLYGLFAAGLLRSALLVRTLQRTNRLLRKSSQRLANLETVAALADMTSGVAHDFNNMIGAVVGRLQLIKLEVKDENTLTKLDTVEQLVLAGSETIQRIQQFVTATRYKNLEPVDLNEVVRRVLASSEREWVKLAGDKNVKFNPRLADPEAIIDGFEPDLATLIEKLIENAVEHSPANATVEVVLKADRKRCRLSVVDHGPGVPEDHKDKIFYPFFTTKKSRGAGMSLATAHGVAVRHGGTIEVANSRSGGAVFTVTFEHREKQDEISEITKKTIKLDRLRILVVDDDDQIREILKDMLILEGHQARACPDGYAALAALEQEPYDFMITDLGMPGMSGLDLAGMVHESYPDIPIAMITGWGTQLDSEEVKAKGVGAVLSKPFHLKDVKTLLQDLASA